MWRAFNQYMEIIGSNHKVNDYDNVFAIDRSGAISMIKVGVIQAMIQIVRPTGWNVERVRELSLEIK